MKGRRVIRSFEFKENKVKGKNFEEGKEDKVQGNRRETGEKRVVVKM